MAKKAGFQQESFTFRIFALIFIHPAGIPQLSTVNFQLSTKYQFVFLLRHADQHFTEYHKQNPVTRIEQVTGFMNCQYLSFGSSQ